MPQARASRGIAGDGRGAGRTVLGDLEISPRSEAAIRLLTENGLENFTDEGVIEIIETVARATAASKSSTSNQSSTPLPYGVSSGSASGPW